MTKTKNKTDLACATKLRLRQRTDGAWEVYACVHGTDRFKWWIISDEKKEWYVNNFPKIRIES